MSSDQKTGGFHYGFLIVGALCLMMATTVGLVFSTAGIFYTPVSTELGVGKGTFGMYISILLLVCAIVLTFAGKVLDRFNARWVLSACIALIGVCFFAMSKFTSVFQFYVAGAFLGISIAFILYLAVPTMINRWFNDRVGFFIGLCAAFTGIGGIIFNPLGGYIIGTYGWRTAYLVWTVIVLFITLPVNAFILRSRPSDKGLKPYGYDASKEGQTTVTASVPLTGVSYTTAIKSPVFYIVALFAFAVAFVTNVNFYLPSYASSLGLAATIGATIASASMFGQLIGKIVLGYANDKSIIKGMIVCFGGGILGMGLLMFFGSVGVWVVLLGGFLYGVSYAGVMVQTPMTIKRVFGNRDYSQINSNISIVAAASSMIGSSAWGFIIDATGGYVATLALACGILVAAFLLGLAALNLSKNFVHTPADNTKAAK